MSPRRLPVSLGLVLVASLAGAQVLQLPKVEVEHDEKADFASFKTYRWKDSQVPADNPTVHASVVWYVERGLRGKGLEKKTEGDSDLLLRYYTSAKEGLKGTPMQPSDSATGTQSNLSTRVDIRKETHGMLVLELSRASDESLVWKAAAPWSSVDKAKLDSGVKDAVRLLLGKYPPAAAAR
jgi:hypothetical protein